MPNLENGIQHGCNILPFATRAVGESGGTTTTTLAALLAINVVHDASVSAEERLIEIIERSGEVEVLDTEDALADLGIETSEFRGPPASPAAANDNAPLAVAPE